MISFPVYVLMIFHFGTGISYGGWPYEYNYTTKFVTDQMTCQLGAEQPKTTQNGTKGFCFKAKNVDMLEDACYNMSCKVGLDKSTIIGPYGPVFWKPSLHKEKAIVYYGHQHYN